MRRKLAVGVIGVVVAVLLLTVAVVLAGDPVGPGTTPDTTSSYTLSDIYHSLNSGDAATPSTFTEPDAGPGSGTMYTLDQLYALTRERAPVPKSGQTSSNATGDDGDLQRGVAWPDPRFTDNGDGTVTDNLTGLIWLKNANCFGQRQWDSAVAAANTVSNGECGLSDGSVEGDWRLSNLRELVSLIDYGESNPALPSDYPFDGIQLSPYWTSTTYTGVVTNAWGVGLSYGDVQVGDKTKVGRVWPVRGGQ